MRANISFVVGFIVSLENLPTEESWRMHGVLRSNYRVNERNIVKRERERERERERKRERVVPCREFAWWTRISKAWRENEISRDYDVSKLVCPKSQHKVPRSRWFVTKSNRERIRLPRGSHSDFKSQMYYVVIVFCIQYCIGIFIGVL